MTVNRETIRDALATGLSAKYGANVQEVIGHRTDDLEGKTPLVMVLSANSDRPRLTARGNLATLTFEIRVHVLSKDTGWTEAQAEDRLDLLESLTAEYVSENQESANWNALDYQGPTVVLDAVIGGVSYTVERIYVTANSAK
jgi:hypothetical protein